MAAKSEDPQFALEKIIGKDHADNAGWIASRVRIAQRENFYGSLELIFQEGRCVRVEEKRSHVPPRNGE